MAYFNEEGDSIGLATGHVGPEPNVTRGAWRLADTYILDISSPKSAKGIGRKAENLRFLASKGHKVPRAFIIPYEVKDFYDQDPDGTSARLREDLGRVLEPSRTYAVRSSSSVEDATKHSYAGQFETFLDRQGADQVIQAISKVWQALPKVAASGYVERAGDKGQRLRMAVIVQEMAVPVVSGVSFSRNPLTGSEETVIEAVAGSGEALVQEGATPDRWVVRESRVSGSNDRTRIEDVLVQEIARTTQTIAREYGAPVDLEWVFDGQELNWVQLRDITTIGQVSVYSNTFSKEVLPGLIKPLVWSVNIPLVNGAWVRFLSGLTGVKGLKPADLAKQFYYRAYFNVGALGLVWERIGLPQDSLERLTGAGSDGQKGFKFQPTPKMLVVAPNLASFLLHHFALADQLEQLLPSTRRELEALSEEDLGKLSEEELLKKVDALSHMLEDPIYYNVITPLASNLFNRMLESRLKKSGVDPSSVDVLKGVEDIQKYYPNERLGKLHALFRALDPDKQRGLRETGAGALGRTPAEEGFRSQLERFLIDFGYVSESGNDFSTKPWREDPAFVLKMVIEYPDEVPGGNRKAIEEVGIPARRRRAVRSMARRARRFAVLKERMSTTYTFGYGLYRNYFMELGRRFATRQLIAEAGDVFYLNLDELRQIVSGGCAGNTCNNYRLRAMLRKREMIQLQDVDPPSVIYGEVAPPLAPRKEEELRGTPTSGGYYKGRARVVRSPGEFSRVEQGDVLVIPYSDVAWTPLFAKAGAVVAESGGMLSHTSIIAREYGIPAVVSVAGATGIPDGAEVTVDGYTGVVALSSGDQPK